MALSTRDVMAQRTETAIIRQMRIAERQQRLAKLAHELQHRPWIALYPLAKQIGLSNPDRIYKIFNGTLPTPTDFIDDICTHTGIPLKAVLPPDEYEARRQALRDDMHLQDSERMGY